MSFDIRVYHERPVQLIGGTGGGRFQNTRETEGRVLKAIRVYRMSWCICALYVKFTNDSQWQTYGTTTNLGAFEWAVDREFEFQEGERISQLSLWGNGEGTRSGWIWFRTSLNREFSWGMSRTRQTEYKIPVGSGICVGVLGRHGHHIDSLAFVFLRSLGSTPSRLGNLQYPSMPALRGGRDILQQMAHTAKSDEVVSWVLQGSKQVVDSHSWSLPLALRVGLGAHLNITAVEAGTVAPRLKGVGSNNSSHYFVLQPLQALPNAYNSTQSAISLSTTTTEWCHLSGTLQPGHSVARTAAVTHGFTSTTYSGSVIVYTASVPSFQYSFANGVCSVTGYSDAYII